MCDGWMEDLTCMSDGVTKSEPVSLNPLFSLKMLSPKMRTAYYIPREQYYSGS